MLRTSRLVNLTGAAGVGKTRLALRAASLSRDLWRDGAFLIELDHIRDRGLVADAIASILGVPELGDRDAHEALETYLASRELLLVVDNCEHVLESVATLLDALLRAAPGLHVLATSREVLGVAGERAYHLEPLPLLGEGADGAAGASPAVMLFVDRAASAVPDFELAEANLATIVEICRRLDGLPLALELAAAQLRTVGPKDLAERLEDRFRLLTVRRGSIQDRHRTLRAAIEWSYDLCDKLEQVLWQRLSVFAGSFDLAAAQAVCMDETMTSADVVDGVRGLVNKSILSVRSETGRTRFRLLDTLRAYGSERLAGGPADGRHAGEREVELRARHLAWYSEVAARFERDWFGTGQQEHLTQVKADMAEIRAGLAYAVAHPEHLRTALRTAGSLCYFWTAAGALREGRVWLDVLLDADRQASQERARAVSALTVVLLATGAPEHTMGVAREALELARTEDPAREPRALKNVGILLLQQGDPGGLSTLEEAVALCRARGMTGEDLAHAQAALAQACTVTGAEAAGRSLFAECVATCEAAGDAWLQGVVRIFDALMSWHNGDDRAAELQVTQGLRICHAIPDFHACATGVHVVALLRVGHDDDLAARLMGAADRYWIDAGGALVQGPAWTDAIGSAVSTCRTNLGAKKFAAAHEAGQRISLEDAVALALGERTMRAVTTQSASDPLGLTQRELEVAALVAEGLRNREIAERLVISPRTAETHVQNMLAKTGFRARTQLAAWYQTRAT
jgi:non-specific serine/threonine protein kinase